ncbi:TPA: hypothetical protein ACNICD_003781, partial [Acinetobacter baumannii]
KKHLFKTEKTPISLATYRGFVLNLVVRSYLMLQHQVTKIIRFSDRYDFTFRLVPLLKFYQIDKKWQALYQ